MNKYSIYLNNSSKSFSDRGFEAILAILLSAGALMLLLFFPVAGFALMAFAYGFLCIGTKKFLLGIANNEFLPIETVFSKFKICIKAFCLKIATMLISLLWTIVLIVPGIVTALNYSMASFVMADEDLDALACMAKSKKMVYGHRGEILVLYLSYMFVVVTIMCVCAGIGCAMRLYFNMSYWIPIVSMCLLALFLIFVFVVPYYELMFAHIYVLLKKENESQKIEPAQKRKYVKKDTVKDIKSLN